MPGQSAIVGARGGDADHVAFQHVDEGVVADGPAGGRDGPDQLLARGAGGRAAPEGDVAELGGQVVGGPEAADLGRRHRPEDEAPEELGPLPLAVPGDLDLGVAVHRGQPHADGVGQGPQQLDHLQRHGRRAAGGGRRFGEELPDLVDGEPVGGEHVLDVDALVGPLGGRHRRLVELLVARQPPGRQRLAGGGAVAQGRVPQRVVGDPPVGRQDEAERGEGGGRHLVVAGLQAGHHRLDLAVPGGPVHPPLRSRRTVELSNHGHAILENSPSFPPGAIDQTRRHDTSDVRGWTMSTKPVVVYGASGYTGRLVCEYLREHNIPFVAAGTEQGPPRQLHGTQRARHRDGRLRDRRSRTLRRGR